MRNGAPWLHERELLIGWFDCRWPGICSWDGEGVELGCKILTAYKWLLVSYWLELVIVSMIVSCILATNQWLCSRLVSQSETPPSHPPTPGPHLATISTQLDVVCTNGKHCSLLGIARPLMWRVHMQLRCRCLSDILCSPTNKEVSKFNKVLIFLQNRPGKWMCCQCFSQKNNNKKTKTGWNWMIIQIVISVLKGKAGNPGERGPPGKLVSIVYL